MQAIRRLCFINGRGLSPFASRSGQGYRLRGWRIEAFRSYSEDAKVENFSKSTESSQTEVETLKKNLLETERQLGELKVHH